MAGIGNNNYYQVSGWMLNELNLKGTNLLVYAIIYGFSQDGEGEFNGSLQYLAEATGTSRRTVIKSLKELTEKGYLLKEERTVNKVRFNAYKVSSQVVKKLHGGGEETALGVVKKLHGGSEETAPNNKYNNKDLNNKDNNKTIKSELDEEFEILWNLYPRKQGKQKAKDTYLSARKKGTSFEEVKDGIERYCKYIKSKKVDTQYIKQGSTFFSQHAWQDEYESQQVEDDFDWGDVWK